MECLFLLIRVTSSPICLVTRLDVWEEECSEAVITTEWATVLHIILTSIPIILTKLSMGTSVTSPSLTTTTSCSTLLNMNRNGVSSRFLPPSLSRMLRVTQAQVIVFVL